MFVFSKFIYIYIQVQSVSLHQPRMANLTICLSTLGLPEIGLSLQAKPPHVFPLAIESGLPKCSARCCRWSTCVLRVCGGAMRKYLRPSIIC